MVQQLFYSSAELPADLKCQILSFMRVEWWEGFAGQNRLRDWISPAEHHPVHFVLVESGILISHTEVKWRMLDHAGETYKTYGLSGVFTYPAFRRQGYGAQIVRAGTEYIHQSDADVAVLWCDPKLEGFYAKNGWAPMHKAISMVLHDDGNLSPAIGELLMMRFVSEKGQRNRPVFEREPIHWMGETW
jgi:GNAT superfamily N-acetyltransferase